MFLSQIGQKNTAFFQFQLTVIQVVMQETLSLQLLAVVSWKVILMEVVVV